MKKVDFTEKQKFIEGKVFAEGFDLFKSALVYIIQNGKV